MINFDEIGRDFLYQLGKHKAIQPVRVSGGIDLDIKGCHQLPVEHAAQVVMRMKDGGKSQIIAMKCYYEAFYKGPKILKLNDNEIEHFENTDLSLSVADYSQPFETLIIEFPENYRKNRQIDVAELDDEFYSYLKANGGTAEPDSAIVHHNRKEQFLMVTVRLTNNIIYTFLIEWLDETIEQSFAKCRGNIYERSLSISGNEEELYLKFMKVALNACLFMDQFGINHEGPKNQGHFERLQRQSKNKNKILAERAQRELKTYPLYYSFKQKIKLARSNSPNNRDGQNKIIVSPHWRRGHWKMQPHGPKNSLRKRQYREAQYINSELLVNPEEQLAQTEVTYTS